MAKPGPRAKPATVLRLHGNDWLAKQRDRATPRPHPIAPRPPRYLSAYARECWEVHAPELERLGLLTVLDGASFTFLCESYSLARTALDEMRPRKKDGTLDRRSKRHVITVVDDRGARRRHPAVLVWRQASGDYRSWCSNFGLTPSDRIGLRPGAPIGSEPDDADDEEFFGS
jgi:P27 family predicted phage terminase small subunit